MTSWALVGLQLTQDYRGYGLSPPIMTRICNRRLPAVKARLVSRNQQSGTGSGYLPRSGTGRVVLFFYNITRCFFATCRISTTGRGKTTPNRCFFTTVERIITY